MQQPVDHWDTQPAPISVSVVSHGHLHMLPALLDDLASAQCAVREVILTLNTQSDQTADLTQLLEGRPWPVRIVRNATPKGFGANHNHAARLASAPLLVVLNPDIRLLPIGAPQDPFAHLMRALQPPAALAAPRVLGLNGEVEDSWRPMLTPWRLAKRVLHAASRVAVAPHHAQWAAGMCWLVVRTDFLRLGGFDERLHMYCEDMELCMRLQDAGRTVAYVSSAQVQHAAQRASHRSWRHLAWHLASLLKFWALRAALLRPWHSRSAA